MQQYRALIFWVSVFLTVIICGCATMTPAPDKKPMTPKQQATMWLNIYSQQYDDTMAMAKNPNSTPAQKEMVSKKKAVLSKIHPLLRAYVATVDSGGIPTPEATATLTGLVNNLVALQGGVK